MVSTQLATLLFGLTAALAWGASDFFAAKASKRNSPETAAIWVSIIGVFTYAVIYLLNSGNMGWQHVGIAYAVASGICIELGLYMFYKGLTAGPVSLVSPISSAYPLISTLAILLLFNGSLRSLDILGILIVVVGIVTASGIFESKQSERRISRGVLFGFTTFILWGFAYALLSQAVESIGWQKATLIDTFTGLIALLLILFFVVGHNLKQSLDISFLKDRFILITAFTQLFGGIIFAIGLAHSQSPAVITAISACYPALTVFLALRHFDEKKQTIPIIGGLVAVAGIIILSV
ncbi:MAG: DMT family transporter [Patescibacteria group bacterium]